MSFEANAITELAVRLGRRCPADTDTYMIAKAASKLYRIVASMGKALWASGAGVEGKDAEYKKLHHHARTLCEEMGGQFKFVSLNGGEITGLFVIDGHEERIR